ncbi:MAG: phage integrase SAM-like domain-containing protein [Ginsengibacter sp.]
MRRWCIRKSDHNTAMKYLSNFKKIVFQFIKNGWLQKTCSLHLIYNN